MAKKKKNHQKTCEKSSKTRYSMKKMIRFLFYQENRKKGSRSAKNILVNDFLGFVLTAHQLQSTLDDSSLF